MSPTAPARDYPRLFQSMRDAMECLFRGAADEEALRQSFVAAAEGAGAYRALLFQVESTDPLVLRNLHCIRLTPEHVAACLIGESSPGVSSTMIREVLASGRPALRRDPRDTGDATLTSSVSEGNYSALAAPVLDPIADRPIAVLYFQTPFEEHAYTELDLLWAEGYTRALGLAFGAMLRAKARQEALEAQLRQPENAPDLVGEDQATLALRRELLRTYLPATNAPQPWPILLLGEKGAGKDAVALFLHAYSDRRKGPFRRVNCAELSDETAASRLFGYTRGAFTGAIRDEPGLFRSAHRGVLFLDEIAHLSRRGQAMLLGVLEHHQVQPVGDTRHHDVDVQVILATNRDLDDPQVRADLLLEDFWDRIGVKTLRLLPLRERPWDIAPLAEHFRAVHEKRLTKRTLGFTPEARRALEGYPWPGNVREVHRVCELLVLGAAAGDHIGRQTIERQYPKLFQEEPNTRALAQLAPLTLAEGTSLFQKQYILARLEAYDHDFAATFKSLGISYNTLDRYMKAHGIPRKPALPRADDRHDVATP